jgi:hypothetical protein
MRPEHRVSAAGRLEDVVAIALVSDGELDVITQLDVEPARVAQQHPRTHASQAQHPHDV